MVVSLHLDHCLKTGMTVLKICKFFRGRVKICFNEELFNISFIKSGARNETILEK